MYHTISHFYSEKKKNNVHQPKIFGRTCLEQAYYIGGRFFYKHLNVIRTAISNKGKKFEAIKGILWKIPKYQEQGRFKTHHKSTH